MGLAITKAEPRAERRRPALAGSAGWREHAFWRDHADLLEAFGDRVWPTSAFGFDLDGRPACVLDEFGEVMPCNVRPRNVEVPFRWFLKELRLWNG